MLESIIESCYSVTDTHNSCKFIRNLHPQAVCNLIFSGIFSSIKCRTSELGMHDWMLIENSLRHVWSSLNLAIFVIFKPLQMSWCYDVNLDSNWWLECKLYQNVFLVVLKNLLPKKRLVTKCQWLILFLWLPSPSLVRDFLRSSPIRNVQGY